MKNLFFIKDTLTNKISYYHLLLLLFSFPFDLFYSHIILISLVLHTLIHVKKDRWRSVFTTRNLVLQSVFFVTLVGIVYSPNKAEGFTGLGRQAVIFIMPIVFSLTFLDLKKYRNSLLLGFSICCAITTVYLYWNVFRIIHFYKLPLKTFFSPAFTNHNFSDPIGMHATFFSLQVGMALIYLLVRLINNTSRAENFLYTLCCLILSGGLIQLSSKSVCGAVLVCIGIVIPVFILNGQKRWMFIVSCVFITILSGTILLRSPTFRERYIADLKQDFSKGSAIESVEPRIIRWETAIGLIRKSPVVGYGSGSEIGLLKEAYFDKKLYSSYLNSLNAHNEYLSILIKSGIIGLLFYLATLLYGIRTAIHLKDVMFGSFMLMVIILSLSENLLDVDKGTLFYGFLFSFFMFSKSEIAESKIK